MINTPYVSVIIPTYNRSEMIGITIESFLQQNYPENEYEIIVCDNNSSDKTKAIISQWQKQSRVPLKYIFEKRQGVHYARNTAAKHAHGEILYFTDDDMIADPNLLKEIVKPFFLDDEIATVTGKVLPKWEEKPPNWILSLCNNSLLSLQDKEEYLIVSPYDCGVFSCHQAIKKKILFDAGGFNPENTAGKWIGDGETGLNIKIKEARLKFSYMGSSITYHMIPPSRMTQNYLNKRLANQGNCDSYTDYKKKIYNNYSLFLRIISHIRNLIKHTIFIVIKLILCKVSWRLSRSYLSYYWSRIKYDYALTKNSDLRQLVLKRDWIAEE